MPKRDLAGRARAEDVGKREVEAGSPAVLAAVDDDVLFDPRDAEFRCDFSVKGARSAMSPPIPLA